VVALAEDWFEKRLPDPITSIPLARRIIILESRKEMEVD
jgi:hypothetical protein